jgi:AraC family transcriptional regulator
MALRFSVEEWEGLAGAARYDVRELARICQLSGRQLRRVIRRHFGCSPHDWLNERRLLAAQQLLLSGDPIKKVAFDLGFKQASHFCRRFKFFHRMTPSEFISFRAQPAECPLQITSGHAG